MTYQMMHSNVKKLFHEQCIDASFVSSTDMCIGFGMQL